MDNAVTGQLYLRPKNQEVNGRKLIMVFGVIAVDDDTLIPPETMVPVQGQLRSFDRVLQINAHCDIKLPAEYAGHTGESFTPNQMFTMPIWRV